ncbi:hypothetical protein Barb4_01427 [Bacteroidales bacterium Barb4]|nr:hypothetical protein Barb4_01427 [Bacteroidales bacterium Barb4]
MRYYLDTNLPVFILSYQKDCISREAEGQGLKPCWGYNIEYRGIK